MSFRELESNIENKKSNNISNKSKNKGFSSNIQNPNPLEDEVDNEEDVILRTSYMILDNNDSNNNLRNSDHE